MTLNFNTTSEHYFNTHYSKQESWVDNNPRLIALMAIPLHLWRISRMLQDRNAIWEQSKNMRRHTEIMARCDKKIFFPFISNELLCIASTILFASGELMGINVPISTVLLPEVGESLALRRIYTPNVRHIKEQLANAQQR